MEAQNAETRELCSLLNEAATALSYMYQLRGWPAEDDLLLRIHGALKAVRPDEGYRCPINRLGDHCVRYDRGWFCPECGAKLRLGVWYPPTHFDGDRHA